MSGKFCEKCGAKLVEGSSFCPTCGASTGSEKMPATSNDKCAAMDLQPMKKKRSILKILGGVVGAIFVVMIIGAVLSDGSSGSSKSSGKMIQVKAEEMAKEYSSDLDEANQKYKNKEVEITGKLIHKTQFANSQNYGLEIYKADIGGKHYNVVVDIDKDKVEEANKVKEGDFVKAKGTCVGNVDQSEPNFISIQVHAKSIN